MSEIVKKYGWNTFRIIENDILKKLSKKNNQVIATGGGIILNKENCIIMKSTGTVFYLNVSKKKLIERLILDPKNDQRPSLISSINSQEKEVSSILPQRIELYKQTAHKIINAEKTPKEILKKILSFYNLYKSTT